jgi:hypothetical protein
MGALDVNAVVTAIRDAASNILNTDVAAFKGFSERQVQAIAQQAKLVAAGIATGQITDETRDFFLDGLKDMALSFANTLAGLVAVTIEKIWNAVVGVLWKAISDAAGIALPIPNLALIG